MLQYSHHVGVLSLTALISLAVAIAVWVWRSTAPASQPFIQLMLAVTGYATIAALESASTPLSLKIFWSTLEYVSSGSVITFFLIFARHFTYIKRWLTPRNIAFLWVLPTLNVGLVATNSWHRLVWTNFLLGPTGSNLVIYQHGPGFFWIMACAYAYVLAGTLLLAKAALRPSVLFRQQSSMALVGALVPLIGGSAYTLDLTPPGLNITPMSFMVSGLIYGINLFRFGMFDLIPIARDVLIENMGDGILVLDVKNRIVDVNPAAKHLIAVTAQSVGQPIDRVLHQWQEISALWSSEDFTTELLLDSTTACYLELRVTQLRDQQGRLTGRLVSLRDVTQRRLAELKLQQANQRLQKQLLEIEALQSQLKEQAIRDRLTGLFNRHYFEETFPKELKRAKHQGYAVAIVLMDIDHFKRINDTFGHSVGDRVLQEFGSLLNHHTRLNDIACRYGGEEFVLVIPDIALEQAYQRVEQIRLSFQATWIRVGEQDAFTTISGGICMFPDDGKTCHDLLSLADQALYTAKANGRNSIQCNSRF